MQYKCSFAARLRDIDTFICLFYSKKENAFNKILDLHILTIAAALQLSKKQTKDQIDVSAAHFVVVAVILFFSLLVRTHIVCERWDRNQL